MLGVLSPTVAVESSGPLMSYVNLETGGRKAEDKIILVTDCGSAEHVDEGLT